MNKLIIVVDTAAFEMFEAGLKPYEYRGITPHWLVRVINWKGVSKKMKDDMCNSLKRKTSAARWNFDNDFCGIVKYDYVEFRLGYTKKSITFIHAGTEIGLPNPDYIPKSKTRYGFNPEEEVFIIKLGKRI